MQTILRNKLRLAALLLLVVALFGPGLNQRSVYAASPTFDLYANPGTLTLADGNTVPIWGYSATNVTPTSLPGPVLNVTVGDTVTITLHNNLSEATALLLQGQGLVPDLTGAAVGGTKTYSFTASNPGTYLYEAGLLNNAEHQVAMGLYGALIVRPTTANQAYDASSAYNDEAVLVLSEIDPALNANPAAFDLRTYNPRYFLINGKGYPQTDPISTTAGNKVLLRYINAGLMAHAMTVLGLNQSEIAIDGQPFKYPHSVSAETIVPGQTEDALTTIPASTSVGSKFALYDAAFLNQHNNTAAGYGGMITFISTGTSVVGADTTGPAVSSIQLSPAQTAGAAAVSLSATVSDVSSGNANVSAAEYFIDAIGANGGGIAMTGAFGSPTAAVNASISVAQIGALASGSHTLYVHGQDALGNWGAVGSATLTVDKTGPLTTSSVLTPNPSNGSASVSVIATADERTTGGGTIQAAEYFVDAAGANGTGIAMTVGSATTVAQLSATLSAATLTALPAGAHTLYIHSQDALGNWGGLLSVPLTLDKAGPIVSGGPSATPNPTNGQVGVNSSVQAVRVTAQLTDVFSNIAAVEGFIDTVGANGSGFVFAPSDGSFNSLVETATTDIPLATIRNLSNGNHSIYVHGKDGSGNWGAVTALTLVLDKAAPTLSGLSLNPAAVNNTAVNIGANASDVATGNSNISAAEYFLNTPGVNGTGKAMTVATATPSSSISATIPAADIAALAAGLNTVYVNVKDAAGNWSALVSMTLLVDRAAPTFTGITLTPNSIAVGTASVGLTVNGASDTGGSGVTGGEFWFGAANITAGTGTAFSGNTATINTAALPAGTTTVRVRIRDAAGNWSTGTNGVRTATLTVVGSIPDAIFSDGFESPTTLPGNWTSVSTINTTRLSNTAAAALVGSRGLQAQGNAANYVQFNFGAGANPVTASFDARFYFNPNNNASTGQDIFAAATSNTFGTQVFHVRYRRNGAQPQVQIQVGATANTTWVNITNSTSNLIEVTLSAGTVQLYVGGVLSDTKTGATGSVASIRLGSVTSGGSLTAEFFDAFAAKRSVSPLVGP